MRRTYFPALDSLRFFASANIVLLHFSSSNLLSYADGTFFATLVKGPFFSTSTFFLLSGFIYSILFSNREKAPKLAPFMKERFLRLYPLHIVCALLVFAITFYRTNLLDNTAYAVKTLALHASLLWAFMPKLGHHLNQPSWALSVFFLCYAFTPAFSKFQNKLGKRALWLLLCGSLLASLAAALYFNQIPNALRGINFFSGMLLGRLFFLKAIPLPERAWANDLLLLLATALLCANICFFKNAHSGLAYHFVSPVLQAALLLFLAHGKGTIAQVLSFSWLRAVGKASFYTYLLHCVVIEFLHLYLDKVAHWNYNPFNNPLATLIIMALLYGGCAAYSSRKAAA